MSETNQDQAVLDAKQLLQPAMERRKGKYQCVLCGEDQNVDGNCPNDGLPLRRLPSE